MSNLEKSCLFAQSINQKWDDLKKELDKCPNGFKLKYDEEKGYCLVIDLDVVIQHQENLNP